jgi:hypothetical protein
MAVSVTLKHGIASLWPPSLPCWAMAFFTCGDTRHGTLHMFDLEASRVSQDEALRRAGQSAGTCGTSRRCTRCHYSSCWQSLLVPAQRRALAFIQTISKGPSALLATSPSGVFRLGRSHEMSDITGSGAQTTLNHTWHDSPDA